MRHLAAVFLLPPVLGVAQTPGVKDRTGQTSIGNCSPNIISNGSGPVSVQLLGSCNGADPYLIRELTRSVQKFFDRFPKTIDRLNELLNKKDVELTGKVQEVEAWTKKYSELSHRLEAQPSDDELSKQAAGALKLGDLGLAEALLKDLLAKQEENVDVTARNHFNLGDLYDLRFQPSLALPEYGKAYQYRPKEFSYAFAYANILLQNNRHSESEPIFLAALRIARDHPSNTLAGC